jgi:serine protease
MLLRSSHIAVVVPALVIVTLVMTPGLASASNDTYSSRQWALRSVAGEVGWKAGTGTGITIAIVDTGVDLNHEDMKGAFVQGHDFVDDDSNASDENGHGTHVAGLAAARANNGVGVAGVAPQAKIMPVRVLDETGRGLVTDIDEGVRWAADHGADVINLSLEDDVVVGDVSAGTLTDAIDYAWSKGAVPVTSAGNDEAVFRTELRGAKTLIVTATARDNGAPSYATGTGLAAWGIAAPGGSADDGQEGMVFSTYWTASGRSHYGWAVGTSMSSPHVAGAAAILRGLGLSQQKTVDRLLETAKDIGDPGDDLQFGHGLLDVKAAVAGLGKPAAGPTQAPSSGGGTTPAPAQTSSGAGPDFRPKRVHREFAGPAGSSPAPGSSADPDDRTLASSEEREEEGRGTPAFVLVLVLGTAALAPIAYGSYRLMRVRRGL